jgi:dihydroflavonol-4-reductase
MNVLVTGGTGFLGSNLVAHLAGRGHTVRVLKRPASSSSLLDDFPIEVAPGDVTDLESLIAAARGVEGIYHVAAEVSYWRRRREAMYRVNVGGTRNVIEAAVRSGVRRVIHTSSIATIGYHEDGKPIDENTPWNWGPAGIDYFETKHRAEAEAMKGVARGVEVVAVNPALIFGPRDATWNAGRVFKMARARGMQMFPEGAAAMCDADDVCAAHIEAMTRGRSGERYILAGETVRYIDMFRMAADVMGVRPRVMTVPYALAAAAAWAAYGVSLVTNKEPMLTPEMLRVANGTYRYDSSKAIRELDYAQTPLRVSLEKAYRWYRDAGLLP